MSVFEGLMLVCFGLSWPISIAKAIRTKTVSGKSPLFMVIIFLGYTCGILHKIIFSLDWIILFYIINLLLVGVDLGLYFYFSKVSNSISKV